MGEENLDMDLFGSDDIELNLDDINPEIEEEEQEEENNNLGDDQQEEGQESVAEENEESEEREEETDVNDDADNTNSPSLYSSLAKHLHEEAVLSSLDSDDIKDVSSFNELINKEVEARINSKYTEEDLKNLEYIKTGIPPQELAESNKLVNQLNNINETVIDNNAELRKQLIYQDFINQGLSESKALKLVNRAIELQQDKEDALEALTSIKEFEAKRIEQQKEQFKLQEEQKKAQYEAQQKKLKDTLYKKDEIIKGFKISPTIKDKVYKNMTTIVGKSPEGIPENSLMKARREDPMEFDSKLYYLFEITKGFSDFSVLSKKVKSNATRDMERALRSANFIHDTGNPDYLQDNNSYSGIGDQLNI